MVESRSLSLKTLDVLGAFSQRRSHQTLSQLSRSAGLSLTTTHRIVGDLIAWGALERDARGSYHLGLRLWEVASLAPRAVPLREAALPVMEDLYESTHENVQLAVRQGLEVVYVERIAGRDAVRVLTRVGGRFALHATGVGLVLLAHAPDDVLRRVLDGGLESWTPFTIRDPGQLRQILAQVRRSGIAVSDRQVTPDAVSVAAPIIGVGGDVIAALSVVSHVDSQLSPIALRPAVRAAARSISRGLGR